MSQPAITIPAQLPLAEAEQYFARHRFTALPITDRTGRAVGLLSIDQLEKAPRSAWSTMTAGELADRDPELILGEQEDVAHLLERAGFARVGREAVITSLVDRSGSSRSQTYSAPLAPIVSVILLPAHPTRRMAPSAPTSGDSD